MFSALLISLLSFAPVSHSASSALCANTRVYANGEQSKTCSLNNPNGQLQTLKQIATGAAGEKEFLTLVKAQALLRMRSLAVSLRSDSPEADAIKQSNKLNRFWLGTKGARLQIPQSIDKNAQLTPQVSFRGEKLTAEEQSSISTLYEKQFEDAKPNWEETKAKFLGKDTRLESTVLNARYLPLANQAAQDVETRLHKVAEEEHQKLIEKQPLLNYLHTAEPTKLDLHVARQFYSADLEKEIYKLADLDPSSEAANALALFAPAVSAVLKDHPEYCEAHSALLAKVKSVAMKRAVGTSGTALAGLGGCALAAAVSEGILALPCIFAAATAETAVSAGAASDAYKEANVLYSGYLGRQVSPKVAEERRAEAQGYLLQAGLSALGAATAAPGAIAAARNLPGAAAAEAMAAPKPVARMQAKWREDYESALEVPLSSELAAKTGLTQVNLSSVKAAQIQNRLVYDESRQSAMNRFLKNAAEKPGEAVRDFENTSGLAKLLQSDRVTTVFEDPKTISNFIEQSLKESKLERFGSKQPSGGARFKSEIQTPNGKVQGEIVICAEPVCRGGNGDGRVIGKKGDVITAYVRCGPGVRHIPGRDQFAKALVISDTEERRAAVSQLASEINKVQLCP